MPREVPRTEYGGLHLGPGVEELLAAEAERLGITRVQLAEMLLARCLTDTTYGPLQLTDRRE